MRGRVGAVLVICAAALAVAAADDGAGAAPSQLPPGVLAVVGGEAITVDDFTDEMELRGGALPGQFATVEQRADLLDAMVEARALRVAARAAGFADHPDVVAVCERAMVSTFLTQRLDQELAGVTVSEAEVAAHYEANRDRYRKPERLRAALIFIAVPTGASDELWRLRRARAEEALAEARALPADVEHFGAVATAYSDDQSSRYRGGVIGWIVRHPERQYRWDEAVMEAIYALSEDGAIGPVVRTDDGFYLVRLVRREASELRPLDELEDGIRHQLLQTKRNSLRADMMAQIRTSAGVAMDLAALATVAPPARGAAPDDAKTPPRLPGSGE